MISISECFHFQSSNKKPGTVVLYREKVAQCSQRLLEFTEGRQAMQYVFGNVVKDVGHPWSGSQKRSTLVGLSTCYWSCQWPNSELARVRAHLGWKQNAVTTAIITITIIRIIIVISRPVIMRDPLRSKKYRLSSEWSPEYRKWGPISWTCSSIKSPSGTGGTCWRVKTTVMGCTVHAQNFRHI